MAEYVVGPIERIGQLKAELAQVTAERDRARDTAIRLSQEILEADGNSSEGGEALFPGIAIGYGPL